MKSSPAKDHQFAGWIQPDGPPFLFIRLRTLVLVFVLLLERDELSQNTVTKSKSSERGEARKR